MTRRLGEPSEGRQAEGRESISWADILQLGAVRVPTLPPRHWFDAIVRRMGNPLFDAYLHHARADWHASA